MQAIVEIRTKPAKGTWPNRGPNKYVAVQIVPDGVKPLIALNESVARKRGIVIIQCGDGYHNRIGPNSMFGKAFAKASRIADSINEV